jgi:endonuclease/exonuclease/phosphatase family metal-dependent hydrolase
MWSRSGRRLAGALALSLMLSLMLSAAIAAQTKVVSQNCLHLGWGQRTASKAAGIAGASSAVNVDVMVLQEVMPKGGYLGLVDIVKNLGGLGTYTAQVGAAYGKGSYRETYGFITRATYSAGAPVAAPTNAGSFSRPPTGVVVTVPANAAQFWLLDYHAVFGKNAGLRQAEVVVMAQAAAGFTGVQNLPVLIGGDWNLPTTDPAFQALTNAGFGLGPNVLTSLNPGGTRSSAYDHFAWKPGTSANSAQIMPALMSDAAWRTNVSDHLGIVCRVP